MTLAEATTTFNAFKAAKADPTKTNAEIVTLHNKLYERQRLAKLAGDAAEEKAKNAELVAENARLKAQLAGKSGKSATA
jgi:hypothetical protein